MNKKRSTIDFDWNDDNVRHLRHHGISEAEFEEALLSQTFPIEEG